MKPVSYTHPDVYKRQVFQLMIADVDRFIHNVADGTRTRLFRFGDRVFRIVQIDQMCIRDIPADDTSANPDDRSALAAFRRRGDRLSAVVAGVEETQYV